MAMSSTLMRVMAVLAVAAFVVAQTPNNNAVVRMFGTTFAPNANGLVNIALQSDGTYVFTFSGFPVNAFAPYSVHGIHIHEFGDQSSPTGGNMGLHFNPFNVSHGCPGSDVRHVGDLGNITADALGQINSVVLKADGMNFTFDGTDTGMSRNALGRGLVIHQVSDNCFTQPTGNSSNRLSQGTIGSAQTSVLVGSPYPAQALSARLTDGLGSPLGWAWLHADPTNSSMVEVYFRASGLVPGSIHGIHIHQWGDHSDTTAFLSAGGHWNPVSTNVHRLPYEGENRHMGDLGNVIADADGNVFHRKSYLPIVLGGPTFSNVIGRAFMLHSYPDQGTAVASTGGAGYRLGMGVLGIADPAKFPSIAMPNPLMAYAKMYGTAGRPLASGSVQITHGADNFAQITISLTGLPPSTQLAMHIHEFGDITGLDALPTGGHFNPNGFSHGCYPTTGQRHSGDIGNLPVTEADGSLNAVLSRDWISLVGQNSTIGRAVIVHSTFDDCTSASGTGNAGSRLMQGVLGVMNVGGQNASNPGTYTIRPITNLVAMLTPTTANATTFASGYAWFRANPLDPTRTQVFLNLTGVLPGNAQHGIHVHTYGDWSATDGTSAGGHWNPFGQTHALPTQSDTIRHAGDLGNINSDQQGNVLTTVEVVGLPLAGIMGRGIVLHEKRDQGSVDLVTGLAGLRIALGVIGNTQQPWPTTAPTPGQGPVSSSTGLCLNVDGVCGNPASHTVPSAVAAVVTLVAALMALIRFN